MKNMKKSKCLQFLRDQFKQKYNISIPASAAYKVMASIDERFKPKQRERTPKATWTVKHNETSNETHEQSKVPQAHIVGESTEESVDEIIEEIINEEK